MRIASSIYLDVMASVGEDSRVAWSCESSAQWLIDSFALVLRCMWRHKREAKRFQFVGGRRFGMPLAMSPAKNGKRRRRTNFTYAGKGPMKFHLPISLNNHPLNTYYVVSINQQLGPSFGNNHKLAHSICRSLDPYSVFQGRKAHSFHVDTWIGFLRVV